jgi:hypothetical protein
VDEKDAKRLAGYAELKNSSDDKEKDLAKLLGDKVNPSDFADTAEGLTQINDFIEKLKKYNEASDDSAEGKARKKLETNITDFGDSKTVLQDWITKLETRQQLLEKNHKKQKDEETKPDNF